MLPLFLINFLWTQYKQMRIFKQLILQYCQKCHSLALHESYYYQKQKKERIRKKDKKKEYLTQWHLF